MIKFKLTEQDGTTFNGSTHWEIGKTNRAAGEGTELCSKDVLHYYDSPELAVLLDPIHAGIENPRLFKIDCDSVAHDGLKGGSKYQTPIEKLKLPEVSTTQRVRFAILCAREVCAAPAFVEWSAL